MKPGTFPARIAAIRHRIGEPPANAEVAFGVPQEQQAAIRGLAIWAIEFSPPSIPSPVSFTVTRPDRSPYAIS
jgi:hypothetical protein